jgi:hypothetical protein
VKKYAPKQAEEATRESADFYESAAEECALATSEPAPSHRGRRLRITLLIGNIALSVTCAITVAQFNGVEWSSQFATMNSRIFINGMIIGLQILRFAPTVLVTVLAALGPWRSWLRSLFLLGWIVADIVVHQVLSWSLGFRSSSNTTFWLETVDLILQELLMFVPAALSLALVGSWMSLRIGPAELRPVRISILSVMIATAALGAVMAGQLAVDRAYGARMVYELEYGETIQIEETNEEILVQISYAATLLALVFGIMVAAAYRWWARGVLALLISLYGGISYYFATQAAPQFPFGQTNILLVLYSGSIIGLMMVCVWVAIHIRCLDRSGWPCSRRRRFVAAQP